MAPCVQDFGTAVVAATKIILKQRINANESVQPTKVSWVTFRKQNCATAESKLTAPGLIYS